MNLFVNTIMVLLVLTDLVFLGTSRLNISIRLIAIQGALLGLLPLFIHYPKLPLTMIVLALLAFMVKGILFPWLLLKTVQIVQIRREEEPYIGYTLSLLIGMVLVAIAANLSGQWQPLINGNSERLLLLNGFVMVLSGLLVVISRRTALSQVFGYLILENGVYAFGLVLLHETSFLVELVLLLDAFVAVFVMSTAIHHIKREFNHIDVDQLSILRG